MNKELPSLVLFYIAILSIIAFYIPSSLSQSLVVERDNIESIYEFLEKDKDAHCKTLIIFDIDNTLLEPEEKNNPEQLTSDQWYYSFAQFLKDTYNLTFDQATQVINPINKNLYKKIDFKLVEPIADQLVKSLQDNGYTVIALTARNCGIIDTTVEQLKRNNIDFTRTNKCPHDFKFHVKHPACFMKGVLFSESNDKGQVLEQWMYTVKKTFTKIILVDDKLKNIKNIQREAEKLNLPFVGIRYNYLDEKVKAYRFQPPSEQELEPFLQKVNYVH